MTERIGQQLGNYRLIRLLGQGGFAEVYLAEHIYLKTQVAVKVLHTYLAQSEFAGFLQEAQTIARLKHPHIIPIFDFGVDGSPFLIMDYLPQGSLRQRHPRGTKVPFSTIVIYVNQIAAALQHAHDSKIIHRDVKPENMLVGNANTIVLSDFGIAAQSHSTASLKTVDRSGTPYYMAPEHMQGKPRPASDQYSLGVVVYEWLSGHPPFKGDPLQLMYQHAYTPVPPMRDHGTIIGIEAEQILLKALAKDPQQRFESVQAFAQAFTAAFEKLLAPTVIVPPQPLAPTLPAFHAEPSAEGQAQSQPRVGTPTRSASPLISRASPRPEAFVALHTLRGHSDYVYAVAYSPDGRTLASTSWDETVRLWNAQTGQLLHTLQGPSASVFYVALVNAVAYNPDGRTLANASWDQMVRLWNVQTGQLLHTLQGHSNSVCAVVYSPDGRTLASGSTDQTVRLWNAQTGQLLHTLQGHSDTVCTVAYSPDGRTLASGSTDQTVRLWNAQTGQLLHTLQGHSDTVCTVAYSPDGRTLASGSGDQTVIIWGVKE